ncbi:MAG: transporter permease [Acidimicrobiaceae bacterium]|nr:transporter permease [Acidimicrobiaceae bacterium]
MARLVLRRILVSVPSLVVVSVIVFVLQSLIPGDAADTLAGVNATAAHIAAVRAQLGLNRPLPVQYWHWLDGVFHGSLGNSLINGQPVTSLLDPRLEVTLSLVLGATVVASVIGVLLGTASSLDSRVVRRVLDVVSVVGMAIPSFWVALLLIAWVSVRLGWLPATGYVSLSSSPLEWARSLILPVIALALTGMTAIAKQTREAMLDVLQRDYIRNLRANGTGEGSVIFRHAFRSAAMPVVTMSGLLFIGALGGSVIIEQIFGLPGLGEAAVAATSNKDIPVIQGVAVYFTLLVIGVNLVTDIIYGLLNPKVRTG